MITERVPRRTALKRIVAMVVGLGAAFGVGYAGSRPAAALEAADEFLADDVHVERNDGEVTAVTVAPELQFRWTDFGGGIDGVDVTLSASIEGVGGFDVLLDAPAESEAIAVEGDGFDMTDGTATLVVDRRDLTAIGTSVTADDFGGELAPGESRTTTVELVLRVDIAGAQGETVTALETLSFDVTVHNPEGAATTTGRANTDAE